ncbi:hypothetical protein M3P19_11535 [Muricauda sp. 2012CJ35-5]|uniref:Uncharacterized protein n=1 Tax=Flagellimonas spongiicola TaxID=2942208 RepID=A0ABT0PTG9_9FLAO|nr:hypothetical protein [Allomuricauda spongiicola]MCL6274644.1 hypothetical protein [Allomuricauda spongiicola]
MKENFLEKWILNLVKSEYENGNIPRRATYKLRERMDNFIEVTIEWTDPNENNHKIVYNARSYGKQSVKERIPMPDDPIFELENYYTLEIHIFVNDIKRNYSSRRIANYDVDKVVGELQQLEEIKNIRASG